MSEPMQLVGVKMHSDQLRRLDRELALWSPFVTKRGPMARALIEIAFVCIDAGIVERRPVAEQGLLRKMRATLATAETPATTLTGLTRRETDAFTEGLAIHARRRAVSDGR